MWQRDESFIIAMIEKAPFEPETFDTITSISVLEHIPEDRAALEKMWKLLKPGGQVAHVRPLHC